MKIKLLIPLTAAILSLSSCQEPQKQDAKFSCQHPVTYVIDPIQRLVIENIINCLKIFAFF